jgi:hypothetical protein
MRFCHLGQTHATFKLDVRTKVKHDQSIIDHRGRGHKFCMEDSDSDNLRVSQWVMGISSTPQRCILAPGTIITSITPRAKALTAPRSASPQQPACRHRACCARPPTQESLHSLPPHLNTACPHPVVSHLPLLFLLDTVYILPWPTSPFPMSHVLALWPLSITQRLGSLHCMRYRSCCINPHAGSSERRLLCPDFPPLSV